MARCNSCGSYIEYPKDYDECPDCGGVIEEDELVNRIGEVVYNGAYQHAAGYRW